MNPSIMSYVVNQARAELDNARTIRNIENYQSPLNQYNFSAPQAIPNMFTNLDGGLLGAMPQSYGAARFLNNTSLPINFSAPSSNAQS